MNNIEIINELQHNSQGIVRGLICLIYLWIMIALVTIFMSLLVLLFIPYVLLFDKHKHSTNHLAYYWAKCLTVIYPSAKYRTHGLENLPKSEEAVVYVANHLSQTDVIPVLLLKTRMRWLAKASLFKIPIFGWGMRYCGYIPVERGNRNKSKISLENCKKHLENKIPISFFPEGTRSKDGVIKKFKHGAFSLALEAQVPVIPLTIVGTNNLMKKGSILPQPAVIDIYVHPRIDITKFNTVAKLSNEAKRIIMTKLPPEQCDYKSFINE